MIAGKRVAEKKIPERIHMGSMTRFISPETASMVLSRDETRRPRAEKASDVRMQTKASSQKEPRNGTLKATRANERKTPTSIISRAMREMRNEARYCQWGMGDATRRLRSFFCLASTM